MTTTSHTPGPWNLELEEHRAPSDWMAGVVAVGNPYEGTYRALARVSQPEHAYDDEENARVEADARLIAAAPDLLAALQSILRAYTDAEAGRVGIEPEDAWQARAGIPPWVERIVMPAINKATRGAMPGCQHCGEPHGVSVPCGFRRGVTP